MTAAILGRVAAPDLATFAVAAAVIVAGALGVVLARNPVHGALCLVATLFGVAVLFVEQNADFLAAVQVIVYAGAIVVLFLFVIMLLGVDRADRIGKDPLPGQRPLAILLGAAVLAGILVLARVRWATGAHSVAGSLNGGYQPVVARLADSIFTVYLLPFEATAALLVIAVVSAVTLARRRHDGGDPDVPSASAEVPPPGLPEDPEPSADDPGSGDAVNSGDAPESTEPVEVGGGR